MVLTLHETRSKMRMKSLFDSNLTIYAWLMLETGAFRLSRGTQLFMGDVQQPLLSKSNSKTLSSAGALHTDGYSPGSDHPLPRRQQADNWATETGDCVPRMNVRSGGTQLRTRVGWMRKDNWANQSGGLQSSSVPSLPEATKHPTLKS